MNDSNLVLAFDVSKSALDFASYDQLKNGIDAQGDLKNQNKLILKFLSKYDPATTLVVFEPTGSYSDKLMVCCHKLGFNFSLINPSASNYYTKAMGITTKTDVQAARTLALMGAKLDLPIYKMPSKESQERKRLMRHLCYLEKEQRAILNKIHAEEQRAEICKALMKSLNRSLSNIQAEIKEIQVSIKSLKDDDFEAKKKKGKTVVGIGDKAAEWILTVTNGLDNFENKGQVKKFLGLAPQTHTSGSSVNINQGISKAGPGKVRGVLYMAALSAIRYNKVCKDLYTRLRAKGKAHYKAIIAVMGKLVTQFYTVVTSGVDFDNDYHLKRQAGSAGG